MTRESAYKLNTHITGVLQAKRWKEAVDKIYDDISAEACSNCTFNLAKIGKSIGCTKIEISHLDMRNGFSCNKWEK